MIHESAQDALGYIKRYLEAQADSVLSRQQAGSGDVAAPLPEVLAWLSRRYGLQREGRGVQLLVQSPPRCKPVAINDLVLRQVAENLVSKALKYATESDIEISVRSSAPGFWPLRVEDRGPGIPTSHPRTLYKPFTRPGAIGRVPC